MSKKDPRLCQAPQCYSGLQSDNNRFPGSPILSTNLNSATSPFSPPIQPPNCATKHTIDQRIDSLEQFQLGMLADIEKLETMYNKLQSNVETLIKGGWSVDVGPFQDQIQAHSGKDKNFRQKPSQLETLELSLGADANIQKNNDNVDETDQQHSPTVTAASACDPIRSHLRKDPVSIPPHLRGKKTIKESNNLVKSCSETKQSNVSISPRRHITVDKSIPGFLTTTDGTSTPTDANNPLIIDGNVDQSVPDSGNTRRAPLLTLPLCSPIQPDVPIQSTEDLDLTMKTTTINWAPLFIKQLAPLHPTAASFIPRPNDMISFSADFLRNLLGGTTWSPGLNFIVPKVGDTQRCIIANRSYYTLDMRYEPYLPKHPGEHGAKLSPFFNVNPEEEYRLDEGCSSFDNVPMFVMMPDTNRYIYFGNYSQTRWSDKLDYERMVENVPQKVKEYWAEELSAVGRPEWVTEALKKHFFPKPLYEGSAFRSQVEGSVVPGAEAKHEEDVDRDVRIYVQELKAWAKDVKIKMNWINKEYILNAFEGADADEPVGLRLWWEYLQCVHWNRDFYDMLVTLQSRNRSYD